MNTLQKLGQKNGCKWVSLFPRKYFVRLWRVNTCLRESYYISLQVRHCGTESDFHFRYTGNLGELARKSRVVKREAQSALLDYLHSTRSLRFVDAENMSRNTPEFFYGLLGKVDIDDSEVGRSLARFLRYHPINEFEPFFESIGLKPSEFSSFLPRNLMFLSDDELLLENYYTLCNYGIARNKIGKIYREATGVFSLEYGFLQSKLQSFQNLGLDQSIVVKIIASSPYLLIGNMDSNFKEVLLNLNKAGIEYDWLERHISEENSYNWKHLLKLLCLLNELDLSNEQLKELILQHPVLVLEGSGLATLCLLGFLLKFGFTKSEIRTTFLQFPHISVLTLTRNLRQCLKFLTDIDMAADEIDSVIRSYPLLLGSCELKKVKSLMVSLNCGKNKLCQMVKEDPNVLKKWILGKRTDRVQDPDRARQVRKIKIEFLLNLGYVENSARMEKALKTFRGKGVELQERFDCLLNAGLTREEVLKMLEISPQILNQKKDVLEKKINFFVNELGYPVSDLVSHPPLISYTIERVKLRLLTYKWLKEKGVVHPQLALSTLLSCSEQLFLRVYANCHPKGCEFWEKLKKELYPE